jgi:ABC-type sulfate transport system permease component
MRTILTIFAGFAVVPLAMWIFVAVSMMLSPVARDAPASDVWTALGFWLLGAIVVSAAIMLCGFVVGLVIPHEKKRNR